MGLSHISMIRNKMGIGDALKKLLLEAEQQERLTCGIYESAQQLEENPGNVMFCILPDIKTEVDVSLNIHFTLIEAFCWENEINLLKIDCVEKIGKLFSTTTTTSLTPVNDNDIASGRTAMMDFNCLLVQYPSDSATKAEEDVVEFCKSSTDIMPYPVIELPV